MRYELSSPDTVIARDSSQLYLLSRIAQMVIADEELSSRTQAAVRQSAHLSADAFQPVVFDGPDAQMLMNGLRATRDSPRDPVHPEEAYVAHAAAFMLEEQYYPSAHEINQIPQQMREEELAAQGAAAWYEQVRASRPFDYTERHSQAVDMDELLKD